MKLSWNSASQKPRIIVTSVDESDEFDATTLQHWQDEGFAASYMQLPENPKAFVQQLHNFADQLELGEKYAIVDLTFFMASSAFEEAAEVILEIALKPVPKLCALLAYYPERLPAHGAGYPTSLNLMVHLAGDRTAPPRFHAYSYPEAAPGFAESDLDEYDRVSAGLAWKEFEAKDATATMTT
ncbi:MAG: hypothetical protein Q9183_007179, partial [Haloplaca sp. 2 TL-2023]